MTHNLKTFAAAALTGLSLTAAGALTLSTADTEPTFDATQRGERISIYGCPAEDDCRIDYRGDRNGVGVWVIRKVDH